MRSVILTGFMGTGKSSVGKALAGMTGMDFMDLDSLIVAEAGQSINEIFAQQGESFFRTLETAVLRKIALRDDVLHRVGHLVRQPGLFHLHVLLRHHRECQRHCQRHHCARNGLHRVPPPRR